MNRQRYGLFGRYLGHSLSQVMHQMAFEHHGINAGYDLIEMEPEEFDQRISGIKELDYAGFNITIPYKKAIISHLDKITDDARLVGAVNTIKITDGKWTGYNTDISGFITPLLALKKKFSSCLVLGNGGAAMAVIYALQKYIQPHKIILCARNEAKSREIIKKYDPDKIRSAAFTEAENWSPACDLLVNTTPLGMSPDFGSSPLPVVDKVRQDVVIYDLIYNPPQTRLMSEIKEKKPAAILLNGLPMLVGQAAEAFKIWTGKEFPTEQIYRHLTEM